ncbi:hypothetical protein HanRHA438_Chr09g0415461 [Helianthus annuus]|nr:hypothetical protein HanHA89_Chr09g0352321 [Helianthus annuus]KAJ0630188.1 hypothetical protein HanHA300_Chr00c0427g0763541 [Helianthus annuus]KAJ0708643.1 hypothetical protein HanLR1_Chr09g0331631 [Helianthus annuus]KAJ0889676.1 hypothetical protein HanRHA438_Chr09g0415461 [Helianthus annuus]
MFFVTLAFSFNLLGYEWLSTYILELLMLIAESRQQKSLLTNPLLYGNVTNPLLTELRFIHMCILLLPSCKFVKNGIFGSYKGLLHLAPDDAYACIFIKKWPISSYSLRLY